MVIERDLREWHTHLAAHFAELRESRLKDGLGRPVFGLEHGLDPAEVQALEQAARAALRYRGPSQLHSLVWVVYSSELGYRYSGDEYWQTFERDTPGWDQSGYRYSLRNYFRQFQREFNGAVPSGVWADHFSIICWPITHAVLPKDLQLQLASILYDLRNQFSRDVLESTEALGELIATRSWSATSRFQNFVQETQLVGQIAAALLLQDESEGSGLIHPKTLKRISEDLDQERQAREWLRRARQFAGERVRTRSLGLPNRITPTPSESRLDQARAAVTDLGIEPRLILRSGGSSGESWDVLLEIPDLSHVLLRFPQTAEVLSGSRCTVAGSSGRPLARKRLLYGPQPIPLVRWPQWDEVLLQFEQNDPQLDFLLRTECLLRPGPKWLFRIASDGLAHECRSLRVRPGERYILVSATDQVSPNHHTTAIELNCDGVHGALIDLPKVLPLDWEEALRYLGLEQSRTVEVWPAGLAPVAWDGEGYGEWLESEVPCLGILSDHPLAALSVRVDTPGNDGLDLTSVEPGEPVFLELPQLSVGLHRLHVSAQNAAGGHTGQVGDLDIVIRIREERSQPQIVSPIGPLSVQIDPPSPTLEQLWEGQVDLSLQGPTGRSVETNVSFSESYAKAPFFAHRLSPILFPIRPDDWRDHFSNHLQSRKDAQDAYDAARICTLEFAAGELGEFKLLLERAFTPLRWGVRRRNSGYLVRLFDDSGDPEPAVLSRWSFERPCVEESLSFDSEFQLQESGGMIVARTERFDAAIIVPPALNRIRLEDLRLQPSIERYERSMDSVGRLVDILEIWGRARLPGDLLSAIRQRLVLRGLLGELFRLICGARWARAESQFIDKGTPDALIPLADAVSLRREEIGFGTALVRNAENFARATCNERVGLLSSLMAEYRVARPSHVRGGARLTPFETRNSAGPDDIEWLAEFSLRLATTPGHVTTWAGEGLRTGLAHLFETPTIAKAARFLVLDIECYLQADSKLGSPGPYDGWRWE